jgi:hypothetical protein
MRNDTKLALGIALGASTMLWVMTAVASGRREPWDAGGYWTVAYPLALALAGLLGYAFPAGPWRWALAVIFTQVPVMIAAGSGLGLLPLGVALLAVLALPAVAIAGVAAKIRARHADR